MALIYPSTVLANQDLDDEVKTLIENGYSPDAIYYDQIANGHALYAIVDAATEADAHREAEFRYLGEYFLGGDLPRTACGGNYHSDTDWRGLSYSDLEEKTIAEVSGYYFEEGVQLARFLENFTHGNFPVAELAEMASLSNKQWYDILPVRSHPEQDAIFVSVYKETESISVDGNLGKLAEVQANGDETIPVIFHYYPGNVFPVGAIESDNVGLEIIDLFKSDSTRVSPVPNWKSGDFHTMMLTEDLEDLFDIPDKEDVDEDVWAKIEADLSSNGFTFPIIVQMSAGKGSLNLYSSSERVSVARELGDVEIPVVFFFEPKHDDGINAYCARLIRGDDEIVGFPTPLIPGNPGGPPIPDPPPPSPPPPVTP